VKGKRTLTYLITDGSLTPQNFKRHSGQLLNKLKVAVKAKISMIQIREKQLSIRLTAELTSRVIQIARNSPTKILINDRADLALALGADGVHLTTNSIPTEVIRQNFPHEFIIGVSAHSLAEVQEAKRQGANFVTFSPIFETSSKVKYGAPQGLEKLKEVVDEVGGFPIIALGGIDEDNLSRTLRAGAKGIAGISLFNDSENFAGVVTNINNWSLQNE
jgi:thiamine-phosphate pyrophosphorylase